MCFRKKKKTPAEPSSKEKENPSFEGLAKDFSSLDDQDPVCAKKGDGTD
jgi:hypothetical protein